MDRPDNNTAEGRDLIRELNTGHIPCTRCGCPATTLQARVGEPITPACRLHARGGVLKERVPNARHYTAWYDYNKRGQWLVRVSAV